MTARVDRDTRTWSNSGALVSRTASGDDSMTTGGGVLLLSAGTGGSVQLVTGERTRYVALATDIDIGPLPTVSGIRHVRSWLDLIRGAWLDDPSTPWALDTGQLEQWLYQSRSGAARGLETGGDTPGRSTADLIEECLAALGIGKSTLAEILGISRPTLYAWYDNRVETPEARPLARLQRLAALLREAGITADRPIRRHLVQRPLAGETVALAELLKAPQWDEPRLRRLLAAVKTENEAIEAESLRRRNRDRRRAYADADEGLDTGLTSLEWDNL